MNYKFKVRLPNSPVEPISEVIAPSLGHAHDLIWAMFLTEGMRLRKKDILVWNPLTSSEPEFS